MNVLLTGGSGFLGRRVIRLFARKQLHIIILSRSSKNIRELKSLDGVEIIEGDITEVNSLLNVKKRVGKINVVVHLAALVPKSKMQESVGKILKTNIDGTINLLEVFGGHINGFIYGSTAEIYGPQNSKIPIKEIFPENSGSYYATSKLAAEKVCQIYSKKKNFPVSILRFTTLYGSGDMINRAIPNFIKLALKGKGPQIYGGEDVRDYLHVDEAAQALYLALLKTPNGIFNIGSGKGIKIIDVAKTIVKRINPQITIDLRPPQRKNNYIVLNIEKAKKILGFYPKIKFPDKIEEEIKSLRK